MYLKLNKICYLFLSYNYCFKNAKCVCSTLSYTYLLLMS